jgi:tRNA pseudouridine38-40 synthase
LAEAIGRTARLEEAPAIVCAGRTDAGVHASGQVVHVDLPEDYAGDLARAVNRQTAPAVVVRDAQPAPEGFDFDARRSARWRHYRYLVLNAPAPDPLLAGVAWHVSEPLDDRAMAAAADPLIGEHDFRAFCRRPPRTDAAEPIVRKVTSAGWRRVRGGWTADGWASGGWTESGEAQAQAPRPDGPAGTFPGGERAQLLRFDIVATSFCHQMVRSIVAVLVDAGRGRATAATVMALLASGSRAGAPRPAPAHGLCLVRVGY